MAVAPVRTPRTEFPTLADVPRATWPTTLRVHPAPVTLEGSEETIQCACARTVPAREMIDLRALSPSQLAALGLTTPIECRACFHEHVRHGRALHSAVARALGLHARTTAALEAGEREGLHRGWHVRTHVNRHLTPVIPPSAPSGVVGDAGADSSLSEGADAGAPTASSSGESHA